MRKQTTYFFCVVFFLTAVALSAGYMAGFLTPHASVVSPRIAQVSSELPPVVFSHSFLFENGNITLSVPVSDSVYRGAKNADKLVTLYGNVSENVWVAESYLSMVNDPAQEGAYTALLAEFQKIKFRQGLTDDEYLELITGFVQSLRYETLTDNPAKFPIETVVEGSGDCDDKSLLLAGLLSREGYRVALFSFGPESHMAVGIGASDYLYKNTDYSFIETTNRSFVGVSPDTLRGNLTLQSAPIIIPVGNGTKVYGSSKETLYINEMFILSDRKAAELEREIKRLESDLKLRQEKIAQLELQLQHLKRAGTIHEYNTQVMVHNTLIADYNSRIKTFREIYTRYESYARVHNYILENEHNRPGVYSYVKQNMPL